MISEVFNTTMKINSLFIQNSTNPSNSPCYTVKLGNWGGGEGGGQKL